MVKYALFLQKTYNYSRNMLTGEKRMKRLYLGSTAFTLLLNPQVDFSLILEHSFAN